MPHHTAFTDLLIALGPVELDALAKAFAAFAHDASERRARLDGFKACQERAQAAVAELAKSGRLVAAKIADGAPPELAVAAVAAEIGAPVESVAHHFARLGRSRQGADAEARRLAVVRLALAGQRNADIAARLGVSRRTVERALKGVRWSKMPPGAIRPAVNSARLARSRGRPAPT